MILKRIATGFFTRKISSVRPVAHHNDHPLSCVSLCCAHTGESVLVTELVGEAGEMAKLRDLGVREGAVVSVLCDGDPLMVGVEDARFGIGRYAAMDVLCERIG